MASPAPEPASAARTGTAIPVLWLCGPSGVGKTAVGWELYAQLTQAGVRVGYVDIDQLGMLYPEPMSDPGRHRLQADNLSAVIAAFQSAGTQRVIVSGVVDATHGVYADKLPQAALTVCRLRADHDIIRQRLIGREGESESLDNILYEADLLDTSTFADLCIDTTDLPVPEIARQLQQHFPKCPPHTDIGKLTTTPLPPTPIHPSSSTTDGPIPVPTPVLWLCGPTAVGKSTVGFAIYLSTLRTGRTGAYVDLDQIGFCTPASPDDPANHHVKASILAVLSHNFRAAGAQFLTISGPAEDQAAIKTYADALPGAVITVCRLHASRDQLTHRIMQRGQGIGWHQPGDPLKGQPTPHLLTFAAAAATTADALERIALGDVRIDTDTLTADEAAAAILAKTAWPPSVGGRR